MPARNKIRPPLNYPRLRTNLSLDPRMVARAKKLGINLSEAADAGISAAVDALKPKK